MTAQQLDGLMLMVAFTSIVVGVFLLFHLPVALITAGTLIVARVAVPKMALTRGKPDE